MEGKKAKTPAETDLNPVLPLDVITDILVRLPVKSIGRFRCTAKSWRSLLTSPRFINDHLNIHMNDPEGYIFTVYSRGSSSPYILTFTPGSSCDAISNKVNCVVEERCLVRVSNSCHGLVLLTDQRLDCSKYLMNPITLEAMQVPDGPVSMFSSSGLGYDSCSDDYKIVTLGGIEEVVDIYSVKAKIWRRIENFSYKLGEIFSAPGVFHNGCLHWIAYSNNGGSSRPVILAFSLTAEEFKEVQLPSVVQYDVRDDALHIRCLDGCLALVHSSSRGSIDVWIMKEYGVGASWTKPITINCAEYCDDECELGVVCLLGEDEIILENHWELTKLIAYNWKNGVWRDLVVTAGPGIDSHSICLLYPFRESLLSPN